MIPLISFLLKLLFFLEEHAEADDGSVNQQAAGDGHDHGFDSDEIGMREDGGKGDTHNNEKASEKSPYVKNGSAAALDKVIRIRASAADPVRQRREDVRGDDEQRVVDLVESAGQDDEEESYGEDEGQGDNGLEAGGRHDDVVCVGRCRVCFMGTESS